MKDAKLLDDQELLIKGIEALNDALGPAPALRFLAMHHAQPTDYVEISRQLYSGQSVDDIFARAKKAWGK